MRQESGLVSASRASCRKQDRKGEPRIVQLSNLRNEPATNRLPNDFELPSSGAFVQTDDQCCLGLVNCEPDMQPD